MDEKKVITLETLKTAVDKIKADYPTKAAVTTQIENATTGSSTYATSEEVLALFDDDATPEQNA